MNPSFPLTESSRQPARRAAMLVLVLLLGGATWLVAAPASAQSCWISNGPTVDFGEVGRQGSDTSARLDVTCQRNWFQFTSFRLCLAIPEGSPIGGVAPRWMSNYNGARMAYDLYSDPTRTALIGPPGSGYPLYSTTLAMETAFDFQEQVNIGIYGRVHPNQNLPAAHPFQSQIGGGQVRYSYNVGSLFNPRPSAPTLTQCLTGTGSTGSGIADFHTTVRASFANTCRIIAATDLDFGAVTTLPGNRDQTSTIQLQCPTGAAWHVGLDNGIHAQGGSRRMAGPGGRHLRYELYLDPQRTRRWGNNRGGDTRSGTGTNATQDLPVYGRVPTQPTPVPGGYSDTVTITLTY